MAGQHGFPSRFLSYFATVDRTQRTACSEAMYERFTSWWNHLNCHIGKRLRFSAG
jgi:hypothetical protein